VIIPGVVAARGVVIPPPAPPSLVDQYNPVGANANYTSMTLNMPSYAAGDLIIACPIFNVSTYTCTPSQAGWTVVNDDATNHIKTYYRIATASEPASYVFTSSVAGRLRGSMSVWRGASSVSNFVYKTGTAVDAYTPDDDYIVVAMIHHETITNNNLCSPSYAGWTKEFCVTSGSSYTSGSRLNSSDSVEKDTEISSWTATPSTSHCVFQINR